jgi:signal recognition particle receptor subunit beta/predicted  nucleic acid-binding Zn-ribbon protein
MVIYNAATRELTAKIVYYGPGLCGKTTNLKVLHDRLEPGTAGKLLNLQTQTDRTIYFDLLPVELGDIKGYKIRFQLATVPGQTAFNETRRVVLKGVDGIVFVADSQWTMLPKNLEAWQNLKDNLKTNSINFESLPVVVQYNKRDLADILAVDAMQEALGLSSYPFVEAVASAGRGVTETFKLISKLTFVDLLRRLQGRRAEDAGLPTAADVQAQDDLQSWKDSLLKRDSRDSAAAVPTQKPARPLSLVPPVQDDAPFDTTELGRGVMDEEPSPYSVPAPPELDAEAPASPAATVQMPAISPEMLAGADRNRAADQSPQFPEAEDAAPEVLDEADEVEIDIPGGEPVTDPAFLPPEVAHEGRLEVLEQRLRDYENHAGQEREASERLSNAVSAVQDRVAGAQEQIAALSERLAAIEHGVGGLHEALNAALGRLAAAESATGKTPDLEAAVRGFEARVSELDDRLRAEATNVSELDGRLRAEVARNRKDGDDVAMAVGGLTERAMAIEQHAASLLQRVGSHDGDLSGIRSLSERLPQIEAQVGSLRGVFDKMPELEMQIEAVMRVARELEATLEEKTQLGRREAEDIRGQLAPLLEDRVRRHESDALLFSEMERLRESLAESLHDLAERVRSRVRE